MSNKRPLSEINDAFPSPSTLAPIPLTTTTSSSSPSVPAASNYSSDTFKKLKNELNLLFPGSNAIVHPNVVQYNELSQLDEKTCTTFVDTLRLHGFHRVIKMPSDFASTCNNLYAAAKIFFAADENFKRNCFPEKDTETGYRSYKDRECVMYKKGYACTSEAAKDFAFKLDAYYTDATKISTLIFAAVVKGLGGDVELAKKILPDITVGGFSPSIARVFNYSETPVHTVTCAPHQDLGLITIVPANFPGLEVYSLCGNCGVGWENTNKAMDQTDIIVLCGETLNELANANGGVAPGLHRVVSHERTELMNSLFSNFSSSSPLLSPASNPPPAAAAKGRGRGKKADAKKASSSAQVAENVSTKVGRISIPFLLRARGDVKLDGELIGLKSGPKKDKTIGQFLEEERKKKGTVGLY